MDRHHRIRPHADHHHSHHEHHGGGQEVHEHDLGLTHDLSVMSRRGALRGLLGIAGVGAVAACGVDVRAASTDGAAGSAGSAASATAAATSATTASSAAATCPAAAPGETAGPYPGDGTNGPNVLVESGVYRSDLRSSFGAYSGTAEGVPMTLTLDLRDLTRDCAPGEGLTVYVWHCDRDGNYSLYTATNSNYLRGVQTADAAGTVTFTSVFPGCYSGRWPHIHFEVFDSLAAAVSGSAARLTSQIALPQDACERVYSAAGYESSARNLAAGALARDSVFGDGWDAELATVSGTPETGMHVGLTIGVDAAEKNAAAGAGTPPAGGPGGMPPGGLGGPPSGAGSSGAGSSGRG